MWIASGICCSIRGDGDPVLSYTRIKKSVKPMATLLMDQSIVAGTGQISASIGQLEQTTTTLAEAIGPLQGASERVGR